MANIKGSGVPKITKIERTDNYALFIRIDDEKNKEFWAEILIPFEEMQKLGKGQEIIKK